MSRLRLRPMWLVLLALLAMVTTASTAVAAPAAITGHHCSARDGELVVESIWHMDRSIDDIDAALARPLPAGARLTHKGERPTVLEVRMPLAELDEALPLPIPQGSGLHRVTIDRSLDFVPDPSLGLVLNLGHQSTQEIDGDARRRINAALGDDKPRGAFYLSSASMGRAGGFVGDLATRTNRHGRGMWIAGITFALCALGLALGYRQLSKRAELERAEEVLAAHFCELDDAD